MKRFEKTECPYCGRKVGLAGAWILKTQGEYRCPKCGGISNIVLNKRLYIIAAVAAVVSVILLLAEILFIPQFSIGSVISVGAPFVLFFIVSPFFVRLAKPVVRKKPPSPTRPHESAQHQDLDRTRVMNPIKKG